MAVMLVQRLVQGFVMTVRKCAPNAVLLALRRKLPGFGIFYVYWFIVAVIFMYGGALKDILLVRTEVPRAIL